MDSTYDDLIRAFSINELIARICSGSGSGGSGSVAGEDDYSNGCTNGSDDDGDGAVDCADSDCASDAACSSSGSVTITTTTISSADLNSSYSTTINATGGTTPYEWTLVNNGGFSNLSINSYTGALTGTIDQCPGSYNIIVDVEDATAADSGGPYTDSATLSIEVTSDLSVSRTSGTGSLVSWSSTLQQETFQATGNWLGSLNWTLNSGGGSGFVISAIDDDEAVLKKTGTSTAGTYTFRITATDSSCSANNASIDLSVTVQAAAIGTPGAISGIIETQTYTYPTEAHVPKLIALDSSIFAVAHQTGYNNGYLRSTSIDAAGNITTSQIDATFFNYINGTPSTRPALEVHDPDVIKVSDTISAVAFSTAQGGLGYIATLAVDTAGQVGNGYTQTFVFESNQCSYPDIIHVTGNIYAIAYSGPGNDGWIKTVTIDESTASIALTGNELEFDTSNGDKPDLVNVTGDIFAVAYLGGANTGAVKSLSIDDTGAITELDSLSSGFDTTCDDPSLVAVDSTTLAVAYTGPDNDGWLKTISIDAAGALSLTGSSLEFDTTEGYEPDMIHMGSDIYAIAYRVPSGRFRMRGWVSTVNIDSDGTIGSGVLDTLRLENHDFYEPSMVRVDSDTAAIFHRGDNNVGTLVTVGFE